MLHIESLKDHIRLAIMEFQYMSKTKSYTDGVIFYQFIVLPSGVIKHGWPMKPRIFHVATFDDTGSFVPGLATLTFRQFPRPR